MTSRGHSSVTIIDVSTIHLSLREIMENLSSLPENVDKANAMIADLIEEVVTEQIYMRSKWTKIRQFSSKLACELTNSESVLEVNNIFNIIHMLLFNFLEEQLNCEWAVYSCTVRCPRVSDDPRNLSDSDQILPVTLYVQEVGDYRIMQWERANAKLLLPDGGLKKKVT